LSCLFHCNFGVDPRGSVKLTEMTNAKQWISDVKFSSDGRTLVAGAHDNKVYIYTVAVGKESGATVSSLTLRTTFSKHNSVINHMDLSQDGR
jgi:WD40 repeat protein